MPATPSYGYHQGQRLRQRLELTLSFGSVLDFGSAWLLVGRVGNSVGVRMTAAGLSAVVCCEDFLFVAGRYVHATRDDAEAGCSC